MRISSTIVLGSLALGLAVAACAPAAGTAIGSGGAEDDSGTPPVDGERGNPARTGDGGGLTDASPRDAGFVFANASFDIPTPTSELGMTCPWLDGPNCWKDMIDRATACAPPEGAIGRMSADSRSCTFDDGHVIHFSWGLGIGDEQDGGSTWVTAYQMRKPDGSSCFETAYGWGKQRFRAGAVDVYQSLSAIWTQVTCPDGATYKQSGPDACGGWDWGTRRNAGQVPSNYVSCTNGECTIGFSGATGGRRVIARCRR